MRELSPFLTQSAKSYVRSRILGPEYEIKEETMNTLVCVSLNMPSTGVYFIPRDYDKPKQNAMIHKKDYVAISEFFSRSRTSRNIVIITHAER
ncbi:hypothetical protein [Paenibacillus lutimineralis]|uniref:hypothetical protein n=1 Tax=Paenibacillus lutimineralis TaxID=2707005 RepID=UPI001D05791E|nr:hypothetical protein [Paenibacillus lutimineralis]